MSNRRPPAGRRPALRRSDRAAETREAIIATAARMFLRSGIEGTSLDAVAGELGLTKGAVYASFESKAALVDAVARAHSTSTTVFAALLVPGRTLAQRLDDLGKRLVAARVSRHVVLLDLEYVIYSARNTRWDRKSKKGFGVELEDLAARFRDINEAQGERLPIPELQFLQLLNIVGRGMIQEMALHPESGLREHLAGMLQLLAPSVQRSRGSGRS